MSAISEHRRTVVWFAEERDEKWWLRCAIRWEGASNVRTVHGPIGCPGEHAETRKHEAEGLACRLNLQEAIINEQVEPPDVQH